MKRVIYLAALTVCLLVPASQVRAGVNDFTISSFHADYYISQDESGRSVLKTDEQIIAQFPDYDQNHGIERAIPNRYDGHKTSLAVSKVTDGAGAAWNYTTRQEGDLTVLRIGDASRYVQGTQTYRLAYAQRDVTKYYADTNDDELYWDTNGTGWSQPFQSLTATVHVDPALAGKLTDKYACYQGGYGENEPCKINRQDDQDGSVEFVMAATRPLSAGENVTFAIGFAPHTFAAYQQSAAEKFWVAAVALFIASLFIMSFVGFLLIVWFIKRYNRRRYRKGELGSIPVEYLPPKGVSVFAAAKVFPETRGNARSAAMIDLAVRHYIKIYQTSEKSFFSAARYELELVKPTDGLLAEETMFINTLFGDEKRFALKDLATDTSIASSLSKNDALLDGWLQTPPYDLFEASATDSRWFKRAGIVSILVGLVTLSPITLIAGFTALILAHTFKRLSDTGLTLERYLYGLRDYIKLAEADRLQMLQSPEGAEKVGVSINGDDPIQLVKLYERVLPYAVLFGEEKGWNDLIGTYYEQAGVQPSWYVGQAAFNTAVFSSAMSSFSSSASYSSSSGGSGGGGSSGGGGGGGGGGGW